MAANLGAAAPYVSMQRRAASDSFLLLLVSLFGVPKRDPSINRELDGALA
jgi:hypothetical protein